MPKLSLSDLARHLFALLLCLIPATARAQQTIHVPADQPTIQGAINMASDGDTILVAPGTYYEHLDFSSKAITVSSTAGAATTILDGSNTGTVAFLGTPTGKAPATLSGFTVQHGAGEPTHPPYPGLDYGGGVVIVGSANLLNSTIEDNTSCNVEVVPGGDVTVQGNHILRSIYGGSSGGGCHTNPMGILVHDGATDTLHPVHLDGNLIESNQDCGIETYGATEPLFITHNLIRNNAIFSSLGIKVSDGSNIVIADNIITGNGDAGLLSQTNASLLVVNNTFYGNATQGADGGEASEVDVASVGSIDLINNIIVGTAKNGPPLGCSSPANATQLPLIWDHNLIYNTVSKTGSIPCTGSPGNDNLFVDPKFANALMGDLHLTTGSPAIDAGNDSSPYLDTTDFDGNPRIQDATGKGYGVVDMGAYEFPGQVKAPPTQLALTAAQSTVQSGQSVPLIATATSTLGIPTGTVTLFVDGVQFRTAILNAAGSINFTTAALKPGYHALYATYPGQGVYSPATSVLLYISVANYTPTLSLASSPNPSAVGEDVTFTATIASPDGAVLSPIALADGRNPAIQLTPNANGVATYTTNSLTLGTHNMNATYLGDTTHDPAYANTVTQQVIAPYVTVSTLTSSLNPSTLGQSVTFTAEVSSANGPPTGSLQFASDGMLLATLPLDANQSAAYTTSSLVTGSHSVTATYVPSGLFAGSAAQLTQLVLSLGTATVLTATPTLAVFGSSISLRAVVTPSPASNSTPSGSVTFYNGNTSLGSAPLASGVVVLSVTTLPPGTDQLSAVYGGDSSFGVSNSNVVPVVINAPTALALTTDMNPAGFGQTVTFTAHASSAGGGIPTGTVTFLDGPKVIGSSSLAAGAATFSTNALAIGIHPITVQLNPGAGFAAATSAPLAETIVPYDFTLTSSTPALTIQTGHRASIQLKLQSLGGFSGPVALSCASTLPPYATCLFPDGPVVLAASGSASATFTLDTDAILNFYADTQRSSTNGLLLALLAPLALLVFARRRSMTSALRCGLVLGGLAIFASTLTACGGHYPNSTPPGTYSISITGKGSPTLRHTLPITLKVTP